MSAHFKKINGTLYPPRFFLPGEGALLSVSSGFKWTHPGLELTWDKVQVVPFLLPPGLKCIQDGTETQSMSVPQGPTGRG
ncbi:hypothetical protein GN956_G3417 [Arapaima gigas]